MILTINIFHDRYGSESSDENIEEEILDIAEKQESLQTLVSNTR